MTPETRTSLAIVALLVAVIVVSFLYSRAVVVPPEELAATPAPAAAEGPQLTLPPELVEGQRALAEDRPDEALRLFHSVPSSDPAYAIAVQHVGLAELRRGNVDEALRALEQLAGLEPENPEVHALRSRAQYEAGLYREAEFSALRALELDPRHTQSRYAVALCRVAEDRLVEAVQAYHRAINLSGDRVAAAQAMADVRRLHDRSEGLQTAHYALALLANALRMLDVETTELEHYLGSNPQGPIAKAARERLAGIRSAAVDGASKPASG